MKKVKSKTKVFSSKANSVAKFVNIAFSLATFAMAIYTIIPKYDKFEKVDTDNFQRNFSVKD